MINKSGACWWERRWLRAGGGGGGEEVSIDHLEPIRGSERTRMKTCKHTHQVCRDLHYCRTLSRRRVRCFHVCVLISSWLKCVSVCAVWTQIDRIPVCHRRLSPHRRSLRVRITQPAVFRGVCINCRHWFKYIDQEHPRCSDPTDEYTVKLLILFCFHSDKRWVIYIHMSLMRLSNSD